MEATADTLAAGLGLVPEAYTPTVHSQGRWIGEGLRGCCRGGHVWRVHHEKPPQGSGGGRARDMGCPRNQCRTGSAVLPVLNSHGY